MTNLSKPAIKSRGIVGSASALFTIVGTVSAVFAWWDSIPPDLKQATIYFVTVQLVQFVQVLIALAGRWKAQVPIRGVFRGKEGG